MLIDDHTTKLLLKNLLIYRNFKLVHYILDAWNIGTLLRKQRLQHLPQTRTHIDWSMKVSMSLPNNFNYCPRPGPRLSSFKNLDI